MNLLKFQTHLLNEWRNIGKKAEQKAEEHKKKFKINFIIISR